MTTDQDQPLYREMMADYPDGLPQIEIPEFEPWHLPRHQLSDEDADE